MEQATATGSPATGAFPIERVREQFPLLAREINGASGRLPRQRRAARSGCSPRSRRSPTTSAATTRTSTAAPTPSRPRRPPPTRAPRDIVARHIGAADRREVIFVRNATEALNLVARAWGDANVGAGDRIVLTEMEHHSNIVPWQQLAERVGAEIDWAPIDDDGLLDLDALRGLLERGPKVLAIAHVSNVLGTENPLAEISAMAHEAGAIVVADGAQAAPKMPLDVAALGVDFYAITGHKLYGADRDRRALGQARPAAGDAALPRRRLDDPQGDPRGHHLRRRPRPLRGGHPGDRPGDRDGRRDRMARRRARHGGGPRPRAGDRRLRPWRASPRSPACTVFGPPRGPERLGPVSFEIDGIHAHDVSEILDRHGVAVRAGHHCAQVLMDRLGITATARASFGVYTTTEEIDRLVDGLEDARRVFGL